MSELKHDFGANVRARRLQLGNMSQDILAEKSNISAQTISSIENGKHYPSYNVLVRIAKALKTHPAKLMVGDSDIWTIEDKELQYVLVEAFKNLTPKQREVALKLVGSLAEIELG